MTKQLWLIGVAGILGGAILTVAVFTVTSATRHSDAHLAGMMTEMMSDANMGGKAEVMKADSTDVKSDSTAPAEEQVTNHKAHHAS